MFFWWFSTDVKATFDQLVRLNCFDVHLVITQILLIMENDLKSKNKYNSYQKVSIRNRIFAKYFT